MNHLITFLLLFTIATTVLSGSGSGGAIFARFRNIANHDIVLWWLTPYKDEEIRFFGHLQRNGGMTSFTSYDGHQFFWAPPNKQNIKSERRGFFRTVKQKILYVYDDATDPGNKELISNTSKELRFLDNYYKTYGKHWLSTFNRPEPVVPFIAMNDAQSRIQWVDSNQYQWICDPQDTESSKSQSNTQILDRFRKLMGSNEDLTAKCQNTQHGKKLQFMIETLHSHHPRIYKIANFINEFEANHIIHLSQKHMRRSTVGQGSTDPTRTSSGAWLTMNHTRVVESIYKRIGDVLGIDRYRMTVEAAMGDRATDGVASHMEVVHFDTNQYYYRHYDNSVQNDIHLYFITFQVILRVSETFSGGQTEWPLGEPHYKTESEAYSAVFWYNLLPDGNLDETSMYSHNKVLSGDQWMLHISIWDPALPLHGDPRMPHSVVYAMHDEL